MSCGISTGSRLRRSSSACSASDLYAEYAAVRGPAIAIAKDDLLPFNVSAGSQPCATFGVHSSLGYLALALCMVQVRSVGSQGRSPRHSGVTTPCVSCVYFAVRCRCLQVP